MVFDETGAMLDDLRKAIAEHERRLANSRRQSKKSDVRACSDAGSFGIDH